MSSIEGCLEDTFPLCAASAAGWICPSLDPRNHKVLLLLPPLHRHRLARRGKTVQLVLPAQPPCKLLAQGRHKDGTPRKRLRLLVGIGPDRMPAVPQRIPVPQQPKPVGRIPTHPPPCRPARYPPPALVVMTAPVVPLVSSILMAAAVTVPAGNNGDATVGRPR